VLPHLRTVAYSEIEAFACENLLARMEAGQLDPAPIWTDLKTFPWSEFSGRVDLLTGGYPCQPFSAAGKRLGAGDPRHLWPHIASGIQFLQPRLCFFENVEGHISLGLRDVLRELGELGYRATWGIFSASEVGAPHQRKRVFILALADSIPEGLQRCLREQSHARGLQQQTGRGSDCVWPSRPGQPQHAWEPPRVVGNASEQGFPFSGGQSRPLGKSRPQSEPERSDKSLGNAESGARLGRASGDERHAAQPNQESGDGQAQPAVGRNVDGTAGRLDYAELYATCDNRTDELRLLGNGVVPATASKAFETLINELQTKNDRRTN